MSSTVTTDDLPGIATFGDFIKAVLFFAAWLVVPAVAALNIWANDLSFIQTMGVGAIVALVAGIVITMFALCLFDPLG
jgi:hypothetical protein